MKTVGQHINEHHSGNKAAFGRLVGVCTADVCRWVKRGFIVTSEGWVINPATTKRDTKGQPDGK